MNAKMIIIDEISMLDVNVLECVDQELRHQNQSDLPFGGKHVILAGCRMQLVPPTGAKRSVFGSKYMEMFHHVELHQQMRQADDPKFLAFLRQVGEFLKYNLYLIVGERRTQVVAH